MTRPLLLLGLVFLLLFCVITVLRQPERGVETSSPSTMREEQVRRFWDAYHRATATRMEGDYSTAAQFYRDALALDAKHQDSIFYLAICLQELGRYDEAAAHLRELVRLYPEHNRGWSQLGTVLSSLAPGAQPDLEAAEAAFIRSQEINREHAGSFLSLGSLELNRRHLREAGEWFQVAAGSGAPDGLFLVGLTYYLLDRDREAADYFMRVLEVGSREEAITGRGISSEGDVEQGDELTAFERAGILSRVFLYWTARRLGGYPKDTPDSYRVDESRIDSAVRFEAIPLKGGGEGRGAWIDYDRDGRSDLILASVSGVRLLANTGEGWVERTREVGLGQARPAWDARILDVNGDDWMDAYIVGSGWTGTGSNQLYLNERGRFRDVTREWGLQGERATTAAVAFDVDGDGRRDLLEVGSVRPGIHPVRLFVNQGSRFTERSQALGLDYPTHAVDAAVADFDGDRRQDIFILGWKAPGRLFRNTGSGFQDITRQAGLDEAGGDGLSVLAFDLDRDEDFDLLFTANAPPAHSLLRFQNPTRRSRKWSPRLFRNNGGGRFEEVTDAFSLDRCFSTREAKAGDFDGDGWIDLVFAQGGLEIRHLEPSLILRNRGGKDFVEWTYIPSAWEPNHAVGVAAEDINNDGHLDVFLSGNGLFINRSKRER